MTEDKNEAPAGPKRGEEVNGLVAVDPMEDIKEAQMAPPADEEKPAKKPAKKKVAKKKAARKRSKEESAIDSLVASLKKEMPGHSVRVERERDPAMVVVTRKDMAAPDVRITLDDEDRATKVEIYAFLQPHIVDKVSKASTRAIGVDGIPVEDFLQH